MVKIRRIQLPQGQLEIVRILTKQDIDGWSAHHPFAYEKSILWLEDIQDIPYVRTVEVRCAKSRRGTLRLNTGEHVVGYAKLLANAPRDPVSLRYTRRLFYLKEVDLQRACLPPETAIDPRTVLPGFAGYAPQFTQAPPQTGTRS